MHESANNVTVNPLGAGETTCRTHSMATGTKHATRGLKLLALHGRYQNASVFEQKLLAATADAATTALNGHEVVYVDAPHIVVPQVKLRGACRKPRNSSKALQRPVEPCRVWWEVEKTSGTAVGFEETLNYLRETIGTLTAKGDRLDGVIGFSQGAALAALMCTRDVCEEIGWEPKVAVLCSGYLSNVTSHLPLLHNHNFVKGVESFHAYGERDTKIPAHKSIQLADEMRGAQYMHRKGHAPPCSETQQHIVDWLESYETVGSPPKQLPSSSYSCVF